MPLGIAGWPLREASTEQVAESWALAEAPLAELPKDLLDKVSTKQLFHAVRAAGKEVSLAGTTDFARLDSMSLADYGRYLDIQLAQARFLGASLFRVFLQAEAREDFGRALDNLDRCLSRTPDVETVVETHGGCESTVEGLATLLDETRLRLVVDFGNIADSAAAEFILGSELADRIAYFHLRSLPGKVAAESPIAMREARAMAIYPSHTFLWEPKDLSTPEAIVQWRAFAAALG